MKVVNNSTRDESGGQRRAVLFLLYYTLTFAPPVKSALITVRMRAMLSLWWSPYQTSTRLFSFTSSDS
jgi:hypothetical protein